MFKTICLTLCLLSSTLSFAQLSYKMDSLLQTTSDKTGFVLLIEKHGKVLYQKAIGLANISSGKKINEASNFRMASLTKQFTAMGILLLEKSHRLSVEDKIGRYLPGLPEQIGKSVSIKNLLTHSSGIRDYEDLIPATQKQQALDADVLQLLSKKDSVYFLPGSQFRYSNSGFCLLALIIERVSHQSFSSFIQKNIFTPLGMNTSYVYKNGSKIVNRAMGYAKDSTGKIVFSDQSVTSATKGDGGIYTSVTDYLKWIHALQQKTLLNLQDVIERIHFPVSHEAKNFYAAGWFQMGLHKDILFHSGSTCGFNNYVIEVPQQKFSILYFSNLADNSASFRAILRVIKESGLGDFSNVFSLYDLTN